MSEQVHEKFHDAAGAVDVPGLDPRALLTGAKRARRRFQTLRAGTAAAVLAAVATGTVLAWPPSGEDAQPARGDLPATSAALMAVALEHVDPEPDHFEALQLPEQEPGTLGGDARFDAGEGEDGNLLRVMAVPGQSEERCEVSTCDTVETDRGTVTIGWQELQPEEDPGIVFAVLQLEDQYLLAHQGGPGIMRDPRELDLPISVEDMVAIVSDPRFGLTTTQDALDSGANLSDFPRDGEEPPDPNLEVPNLVPWTPQGLALLVEDQVGNVRSAGRSAFREPAGPTGAARGTTAELADGRVVDLLLVEQPDGGSLACPVGWSCVQGNGVTHAWTEGSAAVFLDRGDFVVRAYVTAPGLEVDGVDDFDRVRLQSVVWLIGSPDFGPLLDAQIVHAGAGMPEWR